MLSYYLLISDLIVHIFSSSFLSFFFQLEICADDEVLEASSCKNTTQVASSIGGPAVEVSERNKVSLAEELDNLMDISIEIASNKRMKKDHLKSFRLTFIDKDIQKKVGFFPITFLVFFHLHISLEMKSWFLSVFHLWKSRVNRHMYHLLSSWLL